MIRIWNKGKIENFEFWPNLKTENKPQNRGFNGLMVRFKFQKF